MTSRILHPLLSLLSSVTRQVAYLKEENRVLRERLPKRIVTTDKERRRLLKAGRKLAERSQGIDPETLKQISVFDPDVLADLHSGTDSVENRQSAMPEVMPDYWFCIRRGVLTLRARSRHFPKIGISPANDRIREARTVEISVPVGV